MADNLCLTYAHGSDSAKAYRLLEEQCVASTEEACKKQFSDPEKNRACVADPDRYLTGSANSVFYKILGRLFSFPTLTSCKLGACSYVKEIGTRDILKPKPEVAKPAVETKPADGSKPEKAFELFVDASRTNLELFVGKPDYKQELEIDVVFDGITKRISPKPEITYTITKESDSQYKMIYSIEISGRFFVKNETITFSGNPSLAFRIWLWKENDFDSINQIRLIIK